MSPERPNAKKVTEASSLHSGRSSTKSVIKPPSNDIKPPTFAAGSTNNDVTTVTKPAGMPEKNSFAVIDHNEYSHKPRNNYNIIEGIKGFFSLGVLVFAAGLIALLITRFAFQSYVVDGTSMDPTLQHNDRLIVYRAPATWARLTNTKYIPGRGEIVVLNVPTKTEPLVKRVIALPGERVVVSNGSITVFNDSNPGGFNPDEGFNLNLEPTYGELDIRVAEDSVFVVGDNRGRNKSNDSRNFDEIGNIASEDIIGELLLRIYPLSNAQQF